MILEVRPILVDGFSIKYLEDRSYKTLYYNSEDENIFGNVYVGDIVICVSNSDKSLKYGEVIAILDDSEYSAECLFLEFRLCGKINRVCFDYFKDVTIRKMIYRRKKNKNIL